MPQIALHNPAVSRLRTRESSRLLELIGAFVSFEFVFVFFLFAGLYKSDPRFEWLPCDATIFFGAINVVQALVLACDRRTRLNPIGVPVTIAGILFALYTLGSVCWSESTVYANYKAAYIATVYTWGLCASALVISSSPARFNRFLNVLVVFAVWVSIECFLFYVSHARFGRVVQIHAMSGEGAYIGLGRAVTWGAVVCAVAWLFQRGDGPPFARSKQLALLGLAFFGVTAAMLGARGPMAAAVFAVLVVALIMTDARPIQNLAKNLRRLTLLSLAGLVALWVYYLRTGSLPLLVLRFMALSSSSQHYDTSGASFYRLELYSAAFYAWLEKPLLGHGIGSFPVIWENSDQRLFPHNLVVEILCELGLCGFLLFLLAPLSAIYLSRAAWLTTPVAYRAAALALCLSAFANTLTSGDLPDNRYFAFSIGLLAFRSPRSPCPREAVSPAARKHPPVEPRAAT